MAQHSISRARQAKSGAAGWVKWVCQPFPQVCGALGVERTQSQRHLRLRPAAVRYPHQHAPMTVRFIQAFFYYFVLSNQKTLEEYSIGYTVLAITMACRRMLTFQGPNVFSLSLIFHNSPYKAPVQGRDVIYSFCFCYLQIYVYY